MIRPRVDTQIDGNPLRNTLLLSLPVEECQLLFPRLTFIPLRTNDVLHEAGESIKYGYFINDGLVSSLSVMEDGRSVEVASLGREGFLGAPLLVGFQSSPGQTIVQIQGAGYRIPAHALIELLPRCPVLSKILQRYAQISGLQSAQTAACNRLHQVEQRLARWLLMCQDKISSNFVPLTQESLAQLLGARRSSVTVAAGLFQTTGLISYSPGQVELLNRPGLEEAACECYGAMVQQASKWNRESA
jgi:CRP-like cAMP-binding protein